MQSCKIACLLIFVVFAGSLIFAEKMAPVDCLFTGKILTANPKEKNTYSVQLESISKATPKAPVDDCGIELKKTFSATYAGSESLHVGDHVRGKSTFNGTAGCVPDENGKMETPPPPTLVIEAKK